MQQLFTSLQGHRCASSTVWKIASESLGGEQSASRAKFYSDLFRLNFGLLGIYTSDWPILGGNYADIYAIFHATVQLGGIFSVLLNDNAISSIAEYVCTLPITPRKDLADLFTLLKWDNVELLNNSSFINAFIDTYIRYILIYEQIYLSRSRTVSNRVIYLVYSAWQGAFLRPYIGIDRSLASFDFLDEAENIADVTSLIEEHEEQEEQEEHEEREDEDEPGMSQKKRQAKVVRVKRGKEMTSPLKEPDIKTSVEGVSELHEAATAGKEEEQDSQSGNKPLSTSATLKEDDPSIIKDVSYSSNILPDAHTCISATVPNPTASAPVTNYNRTGYHLHQITSLSCYNFGQSRIPTYNEHAIPMTDTSSIKGQRLYQKEELCMLRNRGLDTVLNCSWRLVPNDPAAEELSKLHLTLRDKVISDPIRMTCYQAFPAGTHPLNQQRPLGNDKIHAPLIDQDLLSSTIKKHTKIASQIICSLFGMQHSECVDWQSKTPLALIELLELHIMELYNLFLCDNCLTGIGETLILDSPACVFLLYSILSDEIDSFITSFANSGLQQPTQPLSLRIKISSIDPRIYCNILTCSAHIFSTILPRLNLGTNPDLSPDNIYFTLSSQHLGNLDSIVNNLLADSIQRNINLLVTLLGSLLHRHYYMVNNAIVIAFCSSRPVIFHCISLALLSNSIIHPFILMALRLLVDEELSLRPGLVARSTDGSNQAQSFASLKWGNKLQKFANRLASRSYIVHNSLLLLRAAIYNGRFDGQLFSAISTFLRQPLLETKPVQLFLFTKDYEESTAVKVFRHALISTCYGCIDIIQTLVTSGLSAEFHVLLLELLSSPIPLPSELSTELDRILTEKAL
ncbi:Hypothetical protein GSB_153351 [Giardia duodenalis]|uniref:Uncharacterized protein n=2 Tax=Giardia intestinalis TaxID=5741 RepID=C6LNJ4_GIAIB|nr:Hypothetical protein GL50581_298 [Giardia intestinalis ATCC 50581]ESU42127.1 Hypothetical protein GSB_153351 [Giardia intestinalis]